MTFESKAQARYMFATHPKLAKEFASKTTSIKSLPEKVRKDRPVVPNVKMMK